MHMRRVKERDAKSLDLGQGDKLEQVFDKCKYVLLKSTIWKQNKTKQTTWHEFRLLILWQFSMMFLLQSKCYYDRQLSTRSATTVLEWKSWSAVQVCYLLFLTHPSSCFTSIFCCLPQFMILYISSFTLSCYLYCLSLKSSTGNVFCCTSAFYCGRLIPSETRSFCHTSMNHPNLQIFHGFNVNW